MLTNSSVLWYGYLDWSKTFHCFKIKSSRIIQLAFGPQSYGIFCNEPMHVVYHRNSGGKMVFQIVTYCLTVVYSLLHWTRRCMNKVNLSSLSVCSNIIGMHVRRLLWQSEAESEKAGVCQNSVNVTTILRPRKSESLSHGDSDETDVKSGNMM